MRLKKSNKNLNLQTALLNLQGLTNFYQAKCQNSLRAGKGLNLKLYLKSLLRVRLLVKI